MHTQNIKHILNMINMQVFTLWCEVWGSDQRHHRVEKLRSDSKRAYLAVDKVEALLSDQNAVSVRHQGRASPQTGLPGDTCVRPRDQF